MFTQLNISCKSLMFSVRYKCDAGYYIKCPKGAYFTSVKMHPSFRIPWGVMTCVAAVRSGTFFVRSLGFALFISYLLPCAWRKDNEDWNKKSIY